MGLEFENVEFSTAYGDYIASFAGEDGTVYNFRLFSGRLPFFIVYDSIKRSVVWYVREEVLTWNYYENGLYGVKVTCSFLESLLLLLPHFSRWDLKKTGKPHYNCGLPCNICYVWTCGYILVPELASCLCMSFLRRNRFFNSGWQNSQNGMGEVFG